MDRATFIISRDGKEIARRPDGEVLGWFMRHTNFSMHYALKYDGYTVEKANPAP